MMTTMFGSKSPYISRKDMEPKPEMYPQLHGALFKKAIFKVKKLFFQDDAF